MPTNEFGKSTAKQRVHHVSSIFRQRNSAGTRDTSRVERAFEVKSSLRSDGGYKRLSSAEADIFSTRLTTRIYLPNRRANVPRSDKCGYLLAGRPGRFNQTEITEWRSKGIISPSECSYSEHVHHGAALIVLFVFDCYVCNSRSCHQLTGQLEYE